MESDSIIFNRHILYPMARFSVEFTKLSIHFFSVTGYETDV